MEPLSMDNVIGGVPVYTSTFDPKSGTLVRISTPYEELRRNRSFLDDFRKVYPHRYGKPPSPVPETLDIGITNRCGFGCSYCYTDSKPRLAHAKKELITTTLNGFKQMPYQVAIGGGEPTKHPDFIWILEQARKRGVVPNYTTAGHAMTDDIVSATNELCGGVALTYHAWKGPEWFEKKYRALRKKLTCQLNVHVIADRNVVGSIRLLRDIQKSAGAINLVLLAYYPDVGRASLTDLMPKDVYMNQLPEELIAAQKEGMKVAFSEGLFPYFLSRPEIGLNTDYCQPSEGVYSCYVSAEGLLSSSSFAPSRNKKTVWGTPTQVMWDELRTGFGGGGGCYGCPYSDSCTITNDHHYLICKRALHNKP